LICSRTISSSSLKLTYRVASSTSLFTVSLPARLAPAIDCAVWPTVLIRHLLGKRVDDLPLEDAVPNAGESSQMEEAQAEGQSGARARPALLDPPLSQRGPQGEFLEGGTRKAGVPEG
jgi:hypothetical protein